MTWTPFNSHLTALYNTFWNTGSSKPTAHKLILCNSSTWDETASTATVTATQVAAGNGYTTGGGVFASHSATMDTAQARTEGRPASVSFTASGGSIQYDAVVVLSTIGGTDQVALFRKFGATQTINSGQTHTFTVELNLGTATADVQAA